MRLFIFLPSQNWSYMGGAVGVLAENFVDVQGIVDKQRENSPESDITMGFQMEYRMMVEEPPGDYRIYTPPAWALYYVVEVKEQSMITEIPIGGGRLYYSLTPKVLFANGNCA